ncbi:MAG: hypothetical protein KDB02_00215 [Acidimicrobiales bacterium]|nr:hypothetical protein [Acidimicrobiales bacterium]
MTEEAGERVGADPTPVLRSIAEIQRQALLTANEVITRFAGQPSGRPTFGADPCNDGANGTTTTSFGWSPRMFQQVADQVAAAFAAATGLVASVGGNGSTPTDGAVSVDSLEIPAVQVGTESSGVLWLHNRSGASAGPLRLQGGDLVSPDGERLPAPIFDPAEIEDLPDLSSRGVTVTVTVPGSTAPGRYRGIVQVAGAPDAWVPVAVEVLSS